VLKETYREILNDVMDLPRTVQLLKKMEKGEVKYKMIDTDVPSPFSHKTLTFGHADVIMMKSKRMYLQKLHASVLERLGMPVKKIAKQKGKDKGTRPRKQPKTNRKRR
jgi:ATP-dependent Lhr-like helicase